MYIKGQIKLKRSDNICVLLTCMKVELTDLDRTNTRCNAIEHRSFYLVVLLAGCSRF